MLIEDGFYFDEHHLWKNFLILQNAEGVISLFGVYYYGAPHVRCIFVFSSLFLLCSTIPCEILLYLLPGSFL